MRARVAVGVVLPAIVLAGLGGYAVADAYDVVPGFITAEPIPPEPAPFLTAAPALAAAPEEGVVSPISADAPLPDAATVQKFAQELRDDERTGKSTNVSVIDLLTGETLADLGATDIQVPASTTKLLTAIAAVTDMGPDYTTTTSVNWDETTRTLTLVAGGDMMLAADAGHGGAEESPNGWAGMGDLADAVVDSLGSATVEAGPVTVAVDDFLFEAPAVNPEWPQYALDLGYVAPASGVAVDVARTTDEHYAQRYPDPSVAAADVLAERLAERGVTVEAATEDDFTTRAAASAASVEVASVESAPLSAVVRLLLEESDNTVSEIVSLVHALEVGKPSTAAGAAAATQETLAGMGVNTAGLTLYDGAGFSENNRITPLQLSSATAAAVAAQPTADLLDWMPISALTGTLNARMHETPAAGQVRAKTGSLTGVTTLAGAIQTADGRWLAFAVLMDGMDYGQTQPQAALDEFLVALAECGCEG
ncbi:D-alanyl-D-alanine carboxypeptidase/D-alanyl-D-alanine endopeptidase [Demequina sediminicola]|uniref:D-alanyl-D-alanine carboxypeptidase/D-alanyl-D-alanine endopeptidase n=1 Tax=Demequina sediminicola TaxID=1095026 RepID=UPI0009E1ED4B|nr:D-alanyl-D-alanine carboxypeptidase/D-alanyl-D-alanine-endopeptidase [Demequina sediminicola]